MKCPVCGNNSHLISGKDKRVTCCRVCLGKESIELSQPVLLEELPYNLTPYQKRISEKLLKSQQSSILVHAVCGAGKTEIVYEKIKQSLSLGKSVGFVTPRKDVVIELWERFGKYSKEIIGCFYGGSDYKHPSKLIFSTSHQLNHFRNQLDLIVFDEVDAFPFRGDSRLEKLLIQSLTLSGQLIYLSATPSRTLIKTVDEVFYNPCRYHMHPHPKVNVKRMKKDWFKLINFNRKTLIYVPTIKLAEKYSSEYNYPFVTSQSINRDQTIRDFKSGYIQVLFTTTILERGITIEGLDVIVVEADHHVYQVDTLIQIAGRVGRKSTDTDGSILFLYTTNSMKFARVQKAVKHYNDYCMKG